MAAMVIITPCYAATILWPGTDATDITLDVSVSLYENLSPETGFLTV